MVDSFRQWVGKWITPFTLISIFGGIVWGAQLNFLALRTAESVASQRVISELVRSEMQEVAINSTRTAALNEALFAQLQDLVDRVERNESLIYRNGLNRTPNPETP